MLKKNKFSILLISFIIFLISLTLLPVLTSKGNATSVYEIVKAEYRNKQIQISYPQIINFENLSKQKKINEIIKNEALKGLNYYLGIDKGLSLEIKYNIKWKGSNLLSIQYEGVGYVVGTARPNRLFYTTNISINEGSKRRLKDFIYVNKNFVKKFKDKKFKSMTPELMDAFDNITVEDLIKRFNNADSLDNIGTENQSDTFTYFTRDTLGISVDVGHAAGGHAEFEIEYEDIEDNIVMENEVWKDFPVIQSWKPDNSTIRQLIGNYEKSLINAINQNDFSIVEPLLTSGSNLYKSQKILVANLSNRKIREQLLDYQVYDVQPTGEAGVYKVYVHEKIGIQRPGNPFKASEFDWIYTVVTHGDELSLSEIEKWKRN